MSREFSWVLAFVQFSQVTFSSSKSLFHNIGWWKSDLDDEKVTWDEVQVTEELRKLRNCDAEIEKIARIQARIRRNHENSAIFRKISQKIEKSSGFKNGSRVCVIFWKNRGSGFNSVVFAIFKAFSKGGGLWKWLKNQDIARIQERLAFFSKITRLLASFWASFQTGNAVFPLLVGDL